MDIAKLTAPLQPDEVEWKIQQKANGKTLVVPYITNRSIIKRLNEHVGMANWQNELIPVSMEQELEITSRKTGEVTRKRNIHTGFISKLSIKVEDGSWVSRQDTAPLTEIEPLKGGASDAMKRCAVQFGVGLDLYEYPKIYLEGDFPYLPDWSLTLLDKMVESYLAGKLNRAVYILKEEAARKLAQNVRQAA